MAHIADGMARATATLVERHTSTRIAKTFERCFALTLDAAVQDTETAPGFVVTGDIPAMWLRDSYWQMHPYLRLADRDGSLASLISQVSRRQLHDACRDPYANAFNAEPNGAGHHGDHTVMSPWVWERKYEVDSLCAPICLAHGLWERTGKTDHLDEFLGALRAIMAVWRIEQDHDHLSPYRFERPDPNAPTDTLIRNGLGPRCAPTGLTWSAFRPSDDATTLGYNIPGNAMAVVALHQGAHVARAVFRRSDIAVEAETLANQIDEAIWRHGVVEVDGHGPVFAYEVDGLGNQLLMDDANLPSLLALPFIGWISQDDDVYLSTREWVLSEANPYWHSGTYAKGVGSPHTPSSYVWPIALAVEGLTTSDVNRQRQILDLMCATDGDTGLMHESFDVNDPSHYTRPWFSWANAMFCELCLQVSGRDLNRPPMALPRGRPTDSSRAKADQ